MSSYLTPDIPPPPLFVGCDSTELFGLPMIVPADFSMEYTSGPVHAAVGPSTFIRLQPLAPRTWIIEIGETAPPSNTNDERVKRVVKLNQPEVLELYQEMILQDVFSLRRSYYNPDVFAGGRSMLKVTANGDTKTVSISNTSVPEVRDTVALLYDLAGAVAA